MDLTHRAFKCLVTGASGTGKSTFYSRLIIGWPARTKLVFDHEGEFAYRQHVRPAFTPAELNAGAMAGWCIYDPAQMFPGQLPESFRFFCEFGFEAARRRPGSYLFACDELQKLVGTAEMPPELALVLDTGRRYCLDAVLVSQAPNCIHNRIRNQLTEVVTFRHVDARAVDWLAEAGFNPDAVRRLGRGDFIARSLISGQTVCGNVFNSRNAAATLPGNALARPTRAELTAPRPNKTAAPQQ